MNFQYYLLGIVITIAFYKDVRELKIPNLLSLIGALAGILYHLALSRWDGLFFSIVGLIAGFIPLLLLYFFGALGAGDVKLFAAIGAITGMEFVLYCLMYSILYAGMLGVIILLIKKLFVNRILNMFRRLLYLFIFCDINKLLKTNNQELLRFPFMYAVLPGVITTCFYYIA